MAIYNTASDAANTAVRAYLTKVGEKYLGYSFNTSSKKGGEIWQHIKDTIFEGKCAYCDGKGNLQIEHLIMFNKDQCGLHHPGNVVPCCKSCNTRKKESGRPVSWQRHLELVCENEPDSIKEGRIRKIRSHIDIGEYMYPSLSPDECDNLKKVANNLYGQVQQIVKDSINTRFNI